MGRWRGKLGVLKTPRAGFQTCGGGGGRTQIDHPYATYLVVEDEGVRGAIAPRERLARDVVRTARHGHPRRRRGHTARRAHGRSAPRTIVRADLAVAQRALLGARADEVARLLLGREEEAAIARRLRDAVLLRLLRRAHQLLRVGRADGGRGGGEDQRQHDDMGEGRHLGRGWEEGCNGGMRGLETARQGGASE